MVVLRQTWRFTFVFGNFNNLRVFVNKEVIRKQITCQFETKGVNIFAIFAVLPREWD